MPITNDGLARMLQESIDETRLYHARFRTPRMTPDDTDDLEALVEREAERIEQTVGCVTFVDRIEVGRVGPTEAEDVMFYAILPRHTDRELFKYVVEESRHRVMTDATEQADA